MAPAVVQRIAAEALAVVKEPDLIRQLAVVGVEPAGMGPEDFAAVLQVETKRVAETLRAAGIKAK
jgi:tripartite-type tricarboxylate transporter receptor subunit TctC